jgi:hypothetical protein
VILVDVTSWAATGFSGLWCFEEGQDSKSSCCEWFRGICYWAVVTSPLPFCPSTPSNGSSSL